MTLFIYVDEAGNFSGKQHTHFVLAAFTTDAPRVTHKAFTATKQTKLSKRFRSYAEIKFSDAKIPRSFKIKALKRVCAENIGIYALILHKENIPKDLRGRKEGLFYCHRVGELLQLCPLASITQARVFLDRRRLKGLTRKNFDTELRTYLAARLTAKTSIVIEHVDSTTNVNVQIADFIAGAFFQKYERGNNEFYRTIESCIRVEQEILEPSP